MLYLYAYADLSCLEIEDAQRELSDFIACLVMGAYYEKRIWAVNPVRAYFAEMSMSAQERQRLTAQKTPGFRQTVAANSEAVEQLMIELLRYQEWS